MAKVTARPVKLLLMVSTFQEIICVKLDFLLHRRAGMLSK